MNLRKAGKVITICTVGATLLAVLYIMVNGLGQQESLDFGAGAYYYADIPDFDKYTESTNFQPQLPYWVYVALFLAWGALMYWLWKIVDRHGNDKKDNP